MSKQTQLFTLAGAFLLAVLALLGGSALLVRAASAPSATYPSWSFKPLSSYLPPGTQFSQLIEAGEQGELVVETISDTVKSYGLAFGGTLTHILSIGDTAPGGGVFTDCCGFWAYAASPTLVYISTSIDDNGSVFLRHYRWSNNTLTHLPVAAGVIYEVRINDAHGKFVSSQTTGENTEYRITDGVTFSNPITLHKDNPNTNPNTQQELIGITADGSFLIKETISSGTATCARTRPYSSDQTAGTGVTRLFWLGSRSGTIISGSYTSNGCGGTGRVIYSAVMNSAGDVLTHESTLAVPPSGTGGSIFNQLIVYPGNADGPTVVGEGEQVGAIGPYFFVSPKAITEWRQPIFLAATNAQNSNSRLYSGPDPASDAFDGDFTAGFGQDGMPIDLYQFSEKGYLWGYAQLADNSFSQVLGSAATASLWIDPAGGSWGDPANWSSSQVPGSASETLFNLNANYTVNVGAHNAGRVRIEDGFVSFDNANLTLLGPLTLGNDATFDLTLGKLKTDYLVIGALPPADILNPPAAHVQISNPGTELTATAVISISHASPGSIFLDDAAINSGSLVIGENFPGSAALSGQHAQWLTSGATAVGYNYTGTLSIENGAFMRSAGEVIIGQGNSLQEHSSLVQVRNFSTPFNNIGTNWLLLDTFSIGSLLRGELDISHGGRVTLFGDTSILQAGLSAHPAPGFDAFISVDGSADSAAVTSTLETFNDVLLGMANEALVGVNVNLGGQFTVFGADLFLGFAPGSDATMTVAGVNLHNAPALLKVSAVAGTFNTGYCAIGESGTGRLLVHSGGQVECRTVRIGGQPGGSGFVMLDGANGGSTLTTEGGLCIGGDLLGLCDGVETGPQGTLELRNSASVSAGRGTLIGPGGKITGSGDLAVGVLGMNVEPGGMIDPGVNVLAPASPISASLDPAARGPAEAAVIQTGVLQITGTMTLTNAAQVKFDILGPQNYDHLQVSGALQLNGGTLVLAFGNGYAPKQGDAFQFLQAGSTAGNFSAVQITGLQPGFQYNLDFSGGQLQLTALNDGVPNSSPSYRLSLPLVAKGG